MPSQPSPKTQCATGSYTSSDQASMKTQNGPNFARSAKAPVISAGVMMANMHWKIMNDSSGMPGPVRECPGAADVLQAKVVQIADDAALVRPERQRVADDHPLHADEPHHDEALHDGAEHVLAADKPRVEEAESRRHEQTRAPRLPAPTRCCRC